jgi:nicotinamide mononucleotide transporter
MYFLDFFDVNNTFFQVFGYNISYIEFIGTIAGLISVWLATKVSILTWPTGIINQVALFFLFYQVQLYSDMFLQVYFTYVCIYGWIFWRHQKDDTHKISYLNNRNRIVLVVIIALSVVLLGIISVNLPYLFPKVFIKPPSYPYADAFIAILSIVACFLMARKRIESWIFWIIVDLVSIYIYSLKGVLFIALEYVVFLIMSSYGLYNWIIIYRNAKRLGVG